MLDGADTRNPMDPVGLWKQWYDTSSKVWSNVLDGGKETYIDPYGLYRSWLKSMEAIKEQTPTNPFGMMNAKDTWMHWFVETTENWRNAATMGVDPLGLTSHWLEMMEEARAKMLAGESIAADPYTFFKQWYDTASEAWAKVVGDTIGTEKFMEAVSRFLESYTSFTRTFHRASEEYFGNLQLPTRSDVARVAGLVVALEEKVDRIEDAFEDFEDGIAHVATNETVTDLAGRLGRVESKLDTVPTALKKIEAVEDLAKRLDHVESKLDQVLAALGKLEAQEHPEATKPTTVARRKTARKDVHQEGESV